MFSKIVPLNSEKINSFAFKRGLIVSNLSYLFK